VLFKMAKLNYLTKNYLKARAYIQRYHAVGREPDSLVLAINIEKALRVPSEVGKLVKTLKKDFPFSEQAQLY